MDLRLSVRRPRILRRFQRFGPAARWKSCPTVNSPTHGSSRRTDRNACRRSRRDARWPKEPRPWGKVVGDNDIVFEDKHVVVFHDPVDEERRIGARERRNTPDAAFEETRAQHDGSGRCGRRARRHRFCTAFSKPRFGLALRRRASKSARTSIRRCSTVRSSRSKSARENRRTKATPPLASLRGAFPVLAALREFSRALARS